MADDQGTDNDTQDETQDPVAPPPNLDQVHQKEQAKVEEEDENAASKTNGDDEDSDNTAKDDKSDVDDKGESDDAEELDDADESEDTDDKPVDGDDQASDTSDKPADTATELDTDTDKNGPGKVAIQGFDGKIHYFNNLDEIPNDFEPASYKETIRAGKEFARKEEREDREADELKIRQETEATQKRINDMNTSWENDAKVLTTQGVFPKDPAKNEEAKQEVYDYIQSELDKHQKSGGKEGRIITDFTTAYKAMKYDQQQAKATEDQKKENTAKKKRGDMVQAGGGGGNAETTTVRGGGRVLKAPPTGAGLDAVHNNIQNNLS